MKNKEYATTQTLSSLVFHLKKHVKQFGDKPLSFNINDKTDLAIIDYIHISPLSDMTYFNLNIVIK